MKTAIACTVIILLAATVPALSETVRLRAEKVEISSPDDEPQQKQFAITLTAESVGKLGPFTARHVGQNIDVSVAGKHISSPILRSPLHGRNLTLTGTFSDAEMAIMREQMLSSDAIELSSQEP